MNRSMHLRHLKQAEEHVRSGARHISDQELRIADFELYGHDTILARALLETFRHIQVELIAHRDLILRELDH